MQKARMAPADLDTIIRVTCTPEYLFFPDPACVLHHRLGAGRDCTAYTIPAGCGGLLYALQAASVQIRSGAIRTALLVASNTPSSYMNPSDPEHVQRNWLNAAIFGDGASAVLLEASEERQGQILAVYCGAWHENDPVLYPAGGSRHPTEHSNVYEHYFQLDGRGVATHAPQYFNYAIQKLAERHPFSLKNVQWFLFHQANLRVVQKIADDLGIPRKKLLTNCAHYGNTSAASIGILLDEGIDAQKFKKNDKLLLVAIGAGWQYGAALVQW